MAAIEDRGGAQRAGSSASVTNGDQAALQAGGRAVLVPRGSTDREASTGVTKGSHAGGRAVLAPRGSTDREAPTGAIKGSHAGGPRPAASEAPGRWARLYGPTRTPVEVGKQHTPIRVAGASRAREEQSAPAGGTSATVPYFQVYPSYAKEAERAITTEEVPPAYRRQVRAYFDSLKP